MIATLALCAVTFTLAGCIGHTARGIGHSYSDISAAKDRDHALTHASSEETATREKKEEYTDKFAVCVEANGGDSGPCQGFADLVKLYTSVTPDQRVASSGMDPAVKAVVFENLAIGRQEDWGQNAAINRNRRDIDTNTARLDIVEDETYYLWESLDRIEKEYREWDEVYDASHMAEIDAIIDELDELYDLIDEVDGVASSEATEMLRRLSRLEQQFIALRGTKGVK
ncbi:MAG TPA: hypothetical protein QF873_01900 [Patescibacteria group bacterium]|nr:hypothetical protein [Patescibacteria group bacterium]